MDLLLMADQEGNIMATRDAIAHRLRTTREEVDWGLGLLMEPDPGSRNPDDDGRRLRAIDGLGYGWQIVNYGFYRGIRSAEELREANRKRQADFRARNAPVTLRNKSNPSEAEAVSEAISQKAEAKIKRKDARAKRALCQSPEGFSLSDRVRAWAESRGYIRLEEHLEHFITQANARGYEYADWDSALMNAIRRDWANLNPVSQRPKPVSKSAQAMNTIERMKRGLQNSDSDQTATPHVLGSGGPTRIGHDRGDGSNVD